MRVAGNEFGDTFSRVTPRALAMVRADSETGTTSQHDIITEQQSTQLLTSRLILHIQRRWLVGSASYVAHDGRARHNRARGSLTPPDRALSVSQDSSGVHVASRARSPAELTGRVKTVQL